jgi:hypothetical protein
MAADATIEKGPAGLAAPRDHEADGVVATARWTRPRRRP